ncbi:hypothetical protein AAVH_18478 [Aphelenchoides avenae]|nr:hypothetical protein AAVH_18478 [Aphelenchus avenae]
MRARRWVFPLTLWTALVVAVAAKSSVYESVFGAFHGESKPEQSPSSTAVVSPDEEAHHRFKRCSTMCDKSVVFQGPTRSLGMVAGISNVANSTTDGCTKLTIRCLASAGAVYTQVSVARPDGIEVVALEAGVGPTGTTYECGDDGRWMQQNRPVAGEYYCEARLNGSCSNTCDPSTVFGGRVQTRGMVAGTASVAVNMSDGCATITIKCSGLVPNGYTHLAVALAGGVGEIDFQPGVGPLVMSYECGYDGNWTLRGFPIGGEYYCECKVNRGKAVAAGDHDHHDHDGKGADHADK